MSDHVCVRSMMRLIAGSSAVSVRIASPFTIFASVWLSMMIRMHCECGVIGVQSSSLPSFPMAASSLSSSSMSLVLLLSCAS